MFLIISNVSKRWCVEYDMANKTSNRLRYIFMGQNFSYLLVALKYLENYSICCVGVVTLLNKMISYKLFIFPQYVTNIDPNN